MAQVFQLLLLVLINTLWLQGIRLIELAAAQGASAFQDDYRMTVCGRYLALERNLRSALTTWHKIGCAGQGEDAGASEVERTLMRWRDRYQDFDPDSCAQAGPLDLSLHYEKNPALDQDYPNWVVRYRQRPAPHGASL